MTVEELMKEFKVTKSIMGIPIKPEQQRALRYAAIRLEQLHIGPDIEEVKRKERTKVLAELFDRQDVYTYKHEGRTYLMMTEFERVIDELIKGDDEK